MKRTGKVFVFLVLALLSACHSQSAPTEADVAPPNIEKQLVADGIGRQITVPVKITRVVSTAPSITEMIFAVGAGDRLVGVTTFCNYPEQARSIAKIGDTMTPNMETIIALKPDIVFVSTASQLESFVKILEAQGVAVYVLNPGGMMSLYQDLDELGDLFETGDHAAHFVEDLFRRDDYIRTTLNTFSRPKDPIRVFVQISREPLFTIGKGAIMNEIIEAAGGQSVTVSAPSAYPKLSKETALALRPDVIILSDSPDNQEPNDVFKNSPAVKNGRVYKVNADLLSRPGPRLVDALEQIARDLHPERFK